MTQTLPGADIRGYYSALDVTIPDWAGTNVNVRCFAEPDAHQRGDQNPSCAVNTINGAWNCHGCGATGGAFDAATARGYGDAAAMDLMVVFGLAEHRLRRYSPSRRTPPAHHDHHTPRTQPEPQSLAVTVEQLIKWQGLLAGDRPLLSRLERARGWTYDTISALGLGLDRGQITIPTRDEHGQLNGLLRYRPWPRPGETKMIAAPGSRRVLLPHPAAEPSRSILLVEGEPDMIAARANGFPAVAVPGTDTWRSEWAQLLTGRDVTIVSHADPQGRQLARDIEHDLTGIAPATILDLAPGRNDGYDLTDWFMDQAR